MYVAIIPARGGSKRIPRKNIKMFHGKPMIAWSLEATRASGLFEHIIVSTDSDEIADIAISLGAEVPFIRPAELSGDYTGTTEVMAHALTWLRTQDWVIEAACCVYATAPFLRQQDLIRGLDALTSGPWAYAFSVTDFPSAISRSFKKSKCGGVDMFFPEYFSSRSQDQAEAFHDAAQFYWGRLDAWVHGVQIFGRDSYPVHIPRWRVQDIDTEDDWIRAELMAPVVMGYRESEDA